MTTTGRERRREDMNWKCFFGIHDFKNISAGKCSIYVQGQHLNATARGYKCVRCGQVEAKVVCDLVYPPIEQYCDIEFVKRTSGYIEFKESAKPTNKEG